MWMEEILNQLIGVYPIIRRVSTILFGGAIILPSTVCYQCYYHQHMLELNMS